MEAQTARPEAPRPLSEGLPLAEAHARAGPSAGRGPMLALVAIIALAALVYGAAAVAQVVSMPLLNPDELRYTLAAQGVVDGEWLNLRGHEYGLGPVYPLLLAPILALSGNAESAYPLFKLLNVLLFALAAVPIYLLSRRLLSEWWSVGVAAMSLAIPSSIYTSLVLTECTAYLTASIALLTVVLALERPSVPRQLAMLGAVGLAYATRPQFAALVPAYLAGWLLLWALNSRRERLRGAAARLWPTLGALTLVMAGVAGRVLLTSSTGEDTLGGYHLLWRDYDLVSVARFVVYHLAGWEIYLFVVPFVVAPIVVVDLVRAARRGATREGAFVAAFVTVNAALLTIAAAFASTPYGFFELHDRYLFYLAPLWLILFAVWLSSGAPRPVVWTAVGVALALALPAILPFGLIGGNLVMEVAATALWSWVWTVVEGTPHVDGRRVLAVSVVVLAVATAALPRRLWPILPAVVAAGLLLGSAFAWERQADAPVSFTAAEDPNRTWVEDVLPDGTRATKLYLWPPDCPHTELTRHAFFLTEFFNLSVDRTVAIGDSSSDGLPADRVDVGPGGRLQFAAGRPLVADYVVTQPEIQLVGRHVAEGTGAGLVLWETRGAVRLADGLPGSAGLVTATCS
jgi:hypothetical protein